MPYLASKLLWLAAQPSNLTVLLLLAGLRLAWRGRPLGWRLTAGALVLLIGLGYLPAGNALVLPLEQRFALTPPPAPGAPIAGIIMLGGFEDAWVSGARPGLTLNEAAERLTEAVRLAHRFPEARLVFTGGDGSLLGTGSAAAPLGQFLADLGIPTERMVIEARSRTTHENAVELARLLAPRPEQTWVLVTSAYHMPRAVGTFRQAGFRVLPLPVDFRTRGAVDLLTGFDTAADGLRRVDMAAREWVGLLAYWLQGRSSALWPGPD